GLARRRGTADHPRAWRHRRPLLPGSDQAVRHRLVVGPREGRGDQRLGLPARDPRRPPTSWRCSWLSRFTAILLVVPVRVSRLTREGWGEALHRRRDLPTHLVRGSAAHVGRASDADPTVPGTCRWRRAGFYRR